MFDDPIVAEIRKYREEYAARFGYDLEKIVADLQSRQGKDGRQLVKRAHREMPQSSELAQRESGNHE